MMDMRLKMTASEHSAHIRFSDGCCGTCTHFDGGSGYGAWDGEGECTLRVTPEYFRGVTEYYPITVGRHMMCNFFERAPDSKLRRIVSD